MCCCTFAFNLQPSSHLLSHRFLVPPSRFQNRTQPVDEAQSEWNFFHRGNLRASWTKVQKSLEVGGGGGQSMLSTKYMKQYLNLLNMWESRTPHTKDRQKHVTRSKQYHSTSKASVNGEKEQSRWNGKRWKWEKASQEQESVWMRKRWTSVCAQFALIQELAPNSLSSTSSLPLSCTFPLFALLALFLHCTATMRWGGLHLIGHSQFAFYKYILNFGLI